MPNWWRRTVARWGRTPAKGRSGGRLLDLARAAAQLEDVEQRFDETPLWCYRAMDQEHRSRTLSVPEWFSEWHSMAPEDLAPLIRASGMPVTAAGLLSMHPNGYMREEAVRVLARAPGAAALPFLLVRSADWVEPIRLRAQAAARASLDTIAPADVLRMLPLLERMAEPTSRHPAFAAGALDDLGQGVETADLIGGLTHGERRVRRTCAAMLIERGQVTRGVLDIALRQDDVVTARAVGTAAERDLRSPEVLESLWTSSIASLRALALYRYQSTGSPLASRSSLAGLLDSSPSVRFLAQRHLAREGVEVRRHYREALPEEPIALTGLAELGDAQDVEVVRLYLRDDRSGVRVRAIRAMDRLDEQAAAAPIATMLEDPSSSVVRAAARALSGRSLDGATLEALWQRAATTDVSSVRAALFEVFAHQSRWPCLVLACRSIASNDHALRERGETLLASGLKAWNAGSTRPTGEQIGELTDLLSVVHGRVSPAAHSELADLLRHLG